MSVSAGVVGPPLFLGTGPDAFALALLEGLRLRVFAELDRAFGVKEIDVNLGVLILELFVRQQVLLLAVVIALLRVSLHHGHRVLMLLQPRRFFPPVVVQG